MIYILKFVVLIVLVATSARAQDVPGSPSLIQMNSRIFDLRTDVSDLRRDDDFIPLTEIDWLATLLQSDRHLSRVVVHIMVRPQPVATFWPTLEPSRDFPLVDGIPDAFIVGGFQTRSSDRSNRTLLLIPKDNPTDFYVNCFPKDGGFPANCFVYSVYPPDPKIKLMARVYNISGKPYQFRAIAHRIREIAYCLDVTDRLLANGSSPEKTVSSEGETPDLAGCSDLLS